jgi:MoxR-like ATPase
MVELFIMCKSKVLLKKALNSINCVMVGKEDKVELAVSCLLAQGHLIIEGLPGEGKTTLAHTLAAVFGLAYRRVQFTNDLLPADILGFSMYAREEDVFKFHPGPIFTQCFFADEINRASPRTQSALLEAMAEKQVTIEGESKALPNPFCVIATQNPQDQVGTHGLPESQLDRFLICIKLGYMDRESELKVLAGSARKETIKELEPVFTANDLINIQELVSKQYCAEPVLNYLLDIAEFTRETDCFVHGLSFRALSGLLVGAKAYALLQGRDHVLPEDVQMLLAGVVDHRLVLVVSGSQLPSEIILGAVHVVY